MQPELIARLLFLFIVAMAILSGYRLWRSWRPGFWLGERTYLGLSQLQADLERLTGLQGELRRFRVWHRSLVWVDLGGRLSSGRPARVDFTPDLKARFAVAVDPTTTTLWIDRRSFLEHWLGLSAASVDSGDPRFDERYVVRTRGEGRARRAFDQGLKEAVDLVFAYRGVETLEVAKGWLTVAVPIANVEPQWYPVLLDVLDRAARAFDRVPILVRGLGGDVRALAGPGGSARCAYCHDGVSGEDPGLVACDRCHTVLHAGCWEELAHCPVLGCVGREPRRARERA